MKKKILTIVLSALMICAATLALYACGGNDSTSYTVTYVKSRYEEIGNVPIDANEYKQGEKVTLKPATLTLEGYQFAGWNDGEETYQANDEYTMPAKNVTFTSVWSANGYTVSYQNGRTDSSPVTLPDKYAAGDKITLAEKFENFTDENGRAFAGWYTIQNLQEIFLNVGDEFTMPAYNVVFYANWQAKFIRASFYLENTTNAKAYATETYEIGDTISITLPTPPTKDGYDFAGWWRTDNVDIPFDENTKFSEFEKQEGTISLFAKWKQKTENDGQGNQTGPIKKPDVGNNQDSNNNQSSNNNQNTDNNQSSNGNQSADNNQSSNENQSTDNNQSTNENQSADIDQSTNEDPSADNNQGTNENQSADNNQGTNENQSADNNQGTNDNPSTDNNQGSNENSSADNNQSLNDDPSADNDQDLNEDQSENETKVSVCFLLDQDATLDELESILNGENVVKINVSKDGISNIVLPDISKFDLGKYAEGYRFDGWYYLGEDAEGKLTDVRFDRGNTFEETDFLDNVLLVFAMWAPVPV